MMRYCCYCILLFLLPHASAFAQRKYKPDTNPAYPVNKTDEQGRKIGMWWETHPARMGEAAYNEFGNYDNNNRIGRWYKTNADGVLLAILSYKNNLLHGEVQYFENGQLACIGHYRGGNPTAKFDTIYVLNPATQLEEVTVIPAYVGTVKHGMWQFYDTENGRLLKELEYKMDSVIYKKEFPISPEDSIRNSKRILPHQKKHNKPAKSKKGSNVEF